MSKSIQCRASIFYPIFGIPGFTVPVDPVRGQAQIQKDLNRIKLIANADHSRLYQDKMANHPAPELYQQGSVNGQNILYPSLYGDQPLIKPEETVEDYWTKYYRAVFGFVNDKNILCGLDIFYRLDTEEWFVVLSKHNDEVDEKREIYIYTSVALEEIKNPAVERNANGINEEEIKKEKGIDIKDIDSLASVNEVMDCKRFEFLFQGPLLREGLHLKRLNLLMHNYSELMEEGAYDRCSQEGLLESMLTEKNAALDYFAEIDFLDFLFTDDLVDLLLKKDIDQEVLNSLGRDHEKSVLYFYLLQAGTESLFDTLSQDPVFLKNFDKLSEDAFGKGLEQHKALIAFLRENGPELVAIRFARRLFELYTVDEYIKMKFKPGSISPRVEVQAFFNGEMARYLCHKDYEKSKKAIVDSNFYTVEQKEAFINELKQLRLFDALSQLSLTEDEYRSFLKLAQKAGSDGEKFHKVVDVVETTCDQLRRRIQDHPEKCRAFAAVEVGYRADIYRAAYARINAAEHAEHANATFQAAMEKAKGKVDRAVQIDRHPWLRKFMMGITNVLSLLLCGIPNMINYAQTGHVLFFDQPQSAFDIENIEAEVSDLLNPDLSRKC